MEPQKVLLSTTSNTSIGFECLYIVVLKIVWQSIMEYFINFQKIHLTPILKLFRYFMYIEYDILPKPLHIFVTLCLLKWWKVTRFWPKFGTSYHYTRILKELKKLNHQMILYHKWPPFFPNSQYNSWYNLHSFVFLDLK